ncbi:hypothetical protein JOQ06_026260, partial [Pogonophryne albipinna]
MKGRKVPSSSSQLNWVSGSLSTAAHILNIEDLLSHIQLEQGEMGRMAGRLQILALDFVQDPRMLVLWLHTEYNRVNPSAVPQPTFSMPVTVPVSNQNAALQFSNNPGGALVTTTSFLTSALTDPRLLSPQQPTLHRNTVSPGLPQRPASAGALLGDMGNSNGACPSPVRKQEEVETLSEAPQRLRGSFQAQKPREENLKKRDNIPDPLRVCQLVQDSKCLRERSAERQHSPPLNEAPVV